MNHIKITTLIIILLISSCSSTMGTNYLGRKFHGVSKKNGVITSYSISTMNEHKYENNSLDQIKTDITYTDKAGKIIFNLSPAVSIKKCDLLYSYLPNALSEFLPEHNFFKEMKLEVNIIFTYKENTSLYQVNRKNYPAVYFIFDVQECTADHIGDRLLGAFRTTFHEISHLYLSGKELNGSSRKDEYIASKYGLCANLNSQALQEFSFEEQEEYSSSDELIKADFGYKNGFDLDPHLLNSKLGNSDAWFKLYSVYKKNNEVFDKKILFKEFCKEII